MAAKLAKSWSVVRPTGAPDVAKGLAAIERCALSEDYLEGRKAFMEKRKPRFLGR